MSVVLYLNEERNSTKCKITLYDIKNIKLEFDSEHFQEITKKKGTGLKSYRKTTVYQFNSNDDSDDMSLVVTTIESPNFINNYLTFKNFGPYNSSDPKWSRKNSSIIKFKYDGTNQLENLISNILEKELLNEYAVHLRGEYINAGMDIHRINYETVDTSKK